MGTQWRQVKLPAVERTVDLIEILSTSDHDLTLSEISRAIGIPKSSAYYLIQTLLTRGFLFRNRDCRTYSISSRIPELFGHSRAIERLRTALREDLCNLARITRLVATATVRRGAQAVHIEVANPPPDKPPASLRDWVGRYVDLHCTAQGKIHLAYLAEMEFDRVLRGRSLARFTPQSICSKEDLRAHLAKVRSTGFAFNDEECIIGVRAIAAPIFSDISCVIAAIGVTGSTEDIPSKQVSTIARQVIGVAMETSNRILDRFPARS